MHASVAGPVANGFIAGGPWHSRNGPQNLEASPWPHRPVANFLYSQDLATKGIQAGFETVDQGLVNCFKDEVGSLADQMLRTNPAAKLLLRACRAHYKLSDVVESSLSQSASR